jgi:hypothetical protein
LDDKEARRFLEEAFDTLFGPGSEESDILRFFSPTYRQDLNGRVYTFREFLDSLWTLKKQLTSIEVRFTSVVSSGNTIAEVHIVRARRKDGGSMNFKVIAFQTIVNGRIEQVEEVNCPL